jgi:hypothetical protein
VNYLRKDLSRAFDEVCYDKSEGGIIGKVAEAVGCDKEQQKFHIQN